MITENYAASRRIIETRRMSRADRSKRRAVPRNDEAFWKVLTTNVDVDKVCAASVDLRSFETGRIQVFELLVTETLAKLCPGFAWQLTGVTGDFGIDFRGEAKPHRYRIGSVALNMTYVVIGQVKRSARFDRDKSAGIVSRIIDWAAAPSDSARKTPDGEDLHTLSHLMVVVSGRDAAIELYRRDLEEKRARWLPGIPLAFVDARELIRIWSADIGEIDAVLADALNAPQRACIIDYLQEQRSDTPSRGWSLARGSPLGNRVKGAELELRVTVRSPAPLPRQQIGIAWRPGEGIEVIRPRAALDTRESPGSVRVVLDDMGAAQLRLRFSANVEGDVSIGRLDIVEGAGWQCGTGTEPPALELGTVRIGAETIDFGDVLYSAGQQLAYATALETSVRHATNGNVEVIAVTGGAGLGKTRLIEHIADRLHVDSGRDGRSRELRLSFTEPISIAHETELSGSRRFLRDVALALASLRTDAHGTPVLGDAASLNTWIRRWLLRHTRDAGGEIDAALHALMSDTYEQSSWLSVAFLLTICILARSSNGPVFLHLSNLHWADAFEIRVLEEMIHRLRADLAVPNGIVIVLEGRTGELTSAFGTTTTDRWAALYEANAVRKLALLPWDKRQSMQFLEHVLAPMARGADDPDVLDVFQQDDVWKDLCKHVIRVAAGSPMQMIEYLRLLLEERILADVRGRLVVYGDLAGLSATPRSLEELVRLRVGYLEQLPGNRPLISLLRVLAEIGLVIERAALDAIAHALPPQTDLRLLRTFHVIDLPDDDRAEAQFVHETYRAAFRAIPWAADPVSEAIRAAALEYLTPSDKSLLHEIIAWARIMRLSPSNDRHNVRDTLLHALERFEYVRDSEAIAQLCSAVYALGPTVLARGPRSANDIRLTRARALMSSGSWEEALDELGTVAADVTSRESGVDSDLLLADIANDRGNVLGDIMRCADGLRAVGEGLHAVRRVLARRSDEAAVELYERLSNRFGVLHWFSGRPDVGLPFQLSALRSALRRRPDSPLTAVLLCEVGTALLHRRPRCGRALLERSVALLDVRCADETEDYVRAQFQMARLLAPLPGDSHASVEESACAIAYGEFARSSIYCATLSWQTAGAAAFLQGKYYEARMHFREALSSATRARSDRVKWKGHLALATVLSILEDYSAADFHARAAARILIASLSKVGAEARSAWAATIRLPLEHARRIIATQFDELDALLSEIDGGVLPEWILAWDTRPASRSRFDEPSQILHVRRDDHDIFLMG
jgi:tetratricopeptide (TPR) repeat protein